VTPFDSWYSSVIAPQLEKALEKLPVQVHERLRREGRESMAACWNAALSAGISTCKPSANFNESLAVDNVRMNLAALRVTP
jgi:hypothetical protein